MPPNERLVPVAWILETTADLVCPRCTGDKITELEPLVETLLVRQERIRIRAVSPYSADVPIQETILTPKRYKRIPRNELAVHRGADVWATDVRVGRADGFFIGSADWHICDPLLRKGYLWHKNDVNVSFTQIDFVDEDTVYLRLDKRTIESLPAKLRLGNQDLVMGSGIDECMSETADHRGECFTGGKPFERARRVGIVAQIAN